MKSTITPSLKHQGNPPTYASNRNQDCRAWDRRSERLVFGQHPFEEPTDILVTNGLIRFWVGNRGLPAFINVEVFRSGVWRHKGCVHLSASNPLLSARLVSVTPDVATLALSVRNEGTVYVSLRRGERGIRVLHGEALQGESALRVVRFLAFPPAAQTANLTLDAGLFDGAVRSDSDGRARFLWPPSVSAHAWSTLVVWLPNHDNDGSPGGELEDWGNVAWGDGEWGGGPWATPGRILTFEGPGGVVGEVRYEPVAKVIEFELGGNTLTSAPIAFSAGDPIRVLARFSTSGGMALSIKVGAGSPVHLSNGTFLDSGTDTLSVLAFGKAEDGDGVGGRYDQGMIFSDRLIDSESDALIAQTHRADALPSPEARLVWFAPFDTDPVPGVSISPGRAVDSDNDTNGLKRLVVTLLNSFPFGLGLGGITEDLECGAYVVTGASGDTPASVHEQFAAANSQEVRIR